MTYPYDLIMTKNPNNQYLIKAALLTLANFMLVIVGAVVVPNTAMFVAWTMGTVVLHTVLLVWVAVADLNREFGMR